MSNPLETHQPKEVNEKAGFPAILLIAGLIFSRFMMILSATIEGLRGYGDFSHFFNMASLPGWPYLNYWVEFPPFFPFLSSLLYRLAWGREHTYDYLLVIVLTAADAVGLWTFIHLVRRVKQDQNQIIAAGTYLLLMVSLPYFWWYFDPLAVCALLIGLELALRDHPMRAGLVIGLGVLVKLFPILGLAAGWSWTKPKKWRASLLVCAVVFLTLYGILFSVSPGYTGASLASQGSKGSWETVWAVLDGNLRTGNFGPEIERLDPTAAYRPMGNPARIPTSLTLVLFGMVGAAGLLASDPENDRQRIALVGFAWCLFLLWSPGWSPQWVLYLIPLILLVFDIRIGVLLTATLVLANLLEWPILLSRGMFWTLPATILLRTVLLALLAVLFFKEIRHVSLAGIRTAISSRRQ